jgi:hypothetical protein
MYLTTPNQSDAAGQAHLYTHLSGINITSDCHSCVRVHSCVSVEQNDRARQTHPSLRSLALALA